MTADLWIRSEEPLGRITLTREKHLNALTPEMVTAIRKAISKWQTDPTVTMIAIDAQGDRAFCAGGDILALYHRAQVGDLAYARQFWASEYRMNLEIGASVKPVVTFMHGFTMGGGIGLGCHAAYRICDPDTVFSVSQTKIGLAPDAGASFLLALAPGRMGEYLATTADRFNGADAVWLGFADAVAPRSDWPSLIEHLAQIGNLGSLPHLPPPPSALAEQVDQINQHFAGETLGDIWLSLGSDVSDFATATRAKMAETNPLASAAAVEMLHRIGDGWPLVKALELEYRFAHRALELGDLSMGIRARLIDRAPPDWSHPAADRVPAVDTARMLAPLGENTWVPHD